MNVIIYCGFMMNNLTHYKVGPKTYRYAGGCGMPVIEPDKEK